MSYQAHLKSIKYNKNGEEIHVETVQVEFDNNGYILQVEIFNDFFEDWFPVELLKMNSLDKARVQQFVYRQLDVIKERQGKKEYNKEEGL